MGKEFFIVDAHEDIAFHLNYLNRDFVSPDKPCMITLPWLKEGRVKLVFNTIFVHPKHKPLKTVESALDQLSTYDDIYRDYSEDVFQVKSLRDLQKIGEDSKIGFLTLMEGADPIEKSSDIDEFYKRGVRIIGLSWNDKNRYASGNDTHEGLTEEGKELIKRMNDLDVTLDLSHLNEKCFWDAINLTKLTPIATHSNARALTNHPRNLTDEQLLAISTRGGVIGIVLYNNFLKIGNAPPTFEDVFSHADYMVNLCGEDHVGIGSDMDGAKRGDFPKGLQTIANLLKIGQYFLEKGYTDQRVGKIMSGNFLRVMDRNLRG